MMKSISTILFKPVDNSPLVFFRIAFGLLISLEVLGMLFGGWVYRMYIEPEFLFSFMGFEWLQPLPGNGMKYYFILMAALAWMIMLGWHYRFACVSFCILWTASYLMQKTFYNNHNYLYILIVAALAFMPAHRYMSMDTKQKRISPATTCPNWCILFFIAQLGVVYTFASISKMHADWLNGLPIGIWFKQKQSFLIGSLLQYDWVHLLVSYGGMLFDLSIVPFLLWKKTRKYAFAVAIFFHLSNSYLFDIGTFPYVMIASCVFFFSGKEINRLFFKNKPVSTPLKSTTSSTQSKWIIWSLGFYFLIQVLLPLRHWMIPNQVLWTEEGHRMAWRMMLRSKTGTVHFIIKDKTTGIREKVFPYEFLTKHQSNQVAKHPDFIWQAVQILKKQKKAEGKDVAIYVKSFLSLNGRPAQPLIDDSVDLASQPWNLLGNTWILSFQQTYTPNARLSHHKKQIQ